MSSASIARAQPREHVRVVERRAGVEHVPAELTRRDPGELDDALVEADPVALGQRATAAQRHQQRRVLERADDEGAVQIARTPASTAARGPRASRPPRPARAERVAADVEALDDPRGHLRVAAQQVDLSGEIVDAGVG